MGKQKGARPRVFNDDLDPVRVDEIDLVWEDNTYMEREDEPAILKRSNTPRSKSERNVKGEPLGWGDDEILSCVVASSWLWELGALIEDHILRTHGRRKGGRPRLHTAAEWILFQVAVFIYESIRRTDRNLNTINRRWKFPTEQRKWKMLKRVAEKAWPDHPERRLSDQPITRDNHYYFRKTYLVGLPIFEYLEKQITRVVLEAIQHAGLLDPSTGSIGHPDPSQIASGDASWGLGAYKNPPPGEPGHDSKKPYSPGSRPLPGGDKGYGYYILAGVVRGSHPQIRFILFTDLVNRGQNDATLFTQKLIQACQDNPDLTKGLRGAAYDMALRSGDCDRLMDHGIQPINKTARTSTGKTPAVNLGPHTFKTPTKSFEKKVVALNGTPSIDLVDGEGNPYSQPLRRIRTQITPPGKRTRKQIIYTQWAIPDKPLVPQDRVGATTWLRNNSTPAERASKPHTRRTRALRPIPETDPDFKPLHGPRQDMESTFSTYKRQLIYDRLRTKNDDTLRLNLLFYQLFWVNTALVAHHALTGKDVTRWYGNHFPNARAGPIEKVA